MGIYDNAASTGSDTQTKEKKKNKKPWSKKKKIIVSVIAVILAAAVAVSCIFFSKTKDKGTAYSFIRTTTLEKGTLDDSFSSTGTVKSAATSNVTTSLNYSIKSVLVSVGDEVKKGDVIATLDTSDLESQIEREEKSLASSKEQAQSSYDSAYSSYSKANTNVNSAKSSLSSAKTELSNAESKYNNVKNTIKSYQNAYDTALSNYEKAGSEYVKNQTAYNTAVSNFKNGKISSSELVSAAKAYMTAVQNYSGGCEAGSYSISVGSSTSSTPSMGQSQASSGGSGSIQITQTANEICDSVVANVNSLTGKTVSYSTGNNNLLKVSQKASALGDAKTACNYSSIESEYNSAKTSYESAKQTAEQTENSLEQAKNQLKQAETQLENAGSSNNLEELKEQLENCSLKAEQDGTVTALNATVGSAAGSGMGGGGSTVATISDLTKLKITITIPEANINSASIGMSCYITSDASNETLNGTLTQIDPIASDNGSFGAEVTVDSESPSLKVGMNASVQLLVSSKDDVFQVPIDAVGNDDSGDFVYRQTGGEGVDMEFEKVYVTTGESNDYYIEICSDDLAEGDVIRSTSDLTQGIETGEKKNSDSSDSMFGSMFGGRSGMPNIGGNMPDFGSGGFSGMPSGGSGRGGGNFTPPSGGFNG